MNNTANKRILIGVSGSIAAPKAISIIPQLLALGAHVKVIMTDAASSILNSHPILDSLNPQDIFIGKEKSSSTLDDNGTPIMDHIELARWADFILLAPSTANLIAKVANGFGDDLLSTVCLASTAPIAIVPAMNVHMWHNLFLQQNIQKLTTNNVEIWGPTHGDQACGDVGLGRMIEPSDILQKLDNFFAFQTSLSNKNILITAGPTREYIDDVRYLSNASSGKMAYAIAEAANRAGASVTVISGPTSLSLSSNITRINVTSANDMFNAVHERVGDNNIFFGVAAVSDYTPISHTNGKIKKSGNDLTLHLTQTKDIIASVKQANPNIFVVGFAAETNNLDSYAKDKLSRKHMDLIIANKIGKNLGMESDLNQATIYHPSNNPIHFPLQHKSELAKNIVALL